MINVSCAIIEDKNRVLVAQRSETMKHPLKWEFPGGKIIENERAEDCIVRELFEELTIKIIIKEKLQEVIFSYPNQKIILFPFVCEISSGKIQLNEHKQILWLHPSDLLKIDWCEADVPIVQDYLQRKKLI